MVVVFVMGVMNPRPRRLAGYQPGCSAGRVTSSGLGMSGGTRLVVSHIVGGRPRDRRNKTPRGAGSWVKGSCGLSHAHPATRQDVGEVAFVHLALGNVDAGGLGQDFANRLACVDCGLQTRPLI